MKINLNKLHFPVTTLGPGKRIGVWFQGCSIRCPGCLSVDTWEFSRAGEVTLETLSEALTTWLPAADGLTVSGGEPFDQPRALHRFLRWFHEVANDLDVMVYSGYPIATLREKHQPILAEIDALVSGPYRVSENQTQRWWGSDNQEFHLLTERAQQRYAHLESSAINRALDVYADGDGLWFAGVPVGQEWRELPSQLADLGMTGQFSHQPPK